jgi:hypothetical protein
MQMGVPFLENIYLYRYAAVLMLSSGMSGMMDVPGYGRKQGDVKI